MQLKTSIKKDPSMALTSLLFFSGLRAYNQMVLSGRKEDEALTTFIAWIWISSLIMMIGGTHKLEFCALGTLILFSSMPVLSLIGLGWIGCFDFMLWLCFEAPLNEVAAPAEGKEQKRLRFIRKTVISRRITKDDLSSTLSGESCAICLHEFQIGDMICFSPNKKCTHAFHQCCAEKWLSQHIRCPCCRENYLHKAGRKNMVPDLDPAPCLKHG